MKKMIPLQFTGSLTIVIFILFIMLQKVIPTLRRFNLVESIIFIGGLLLLSLLGGSSLLIKKDIFLKRTLGILNLIVAGFWCVMIYGILTFPSQQ